MSRRMGKKFDWQRADREGRAARHGRSFAFDELPPIGSAADRIRYFRNSDNEDTETPQLPESERIRFMISFSAWKRAKDSSLLEDVLPKAVELVRFNLRAAATDRTLLRALAQLPRVEVWRALGAADCAALKLPPRRLKRVKGSTDDGDAQVLVSDVRRRRAEIRSITVPPLAGREGGILRDDYRRAFTARECPGAC